MEKKINFLTVLISVTLLLSVITLVYTISLNIKLNSITGSVIGNVDVNSNNNPAKKADSIKVSADDDPYLGNKNAPVTIIEFSDFQCPYCTRFHEQTFPELKKNYIDTGKVKFVYRDFPLSFHQYAEKASEASECADEQGKFWQYHEKLFDNQDNIGTSSLKQYAKDIGLDASKFNECLDSGKMKDEVSNDLKDGASYGAQGTPAFFINGELIDGAQPFEAFEAIIQEKLKE
ncbi:MAG: DsbA family protein [Nanoarchaeota archaeon]